MTHAKVTEVFVCTNIDCRNRGAEGVLGALKESLQGSGLEAVAVKPYLCFSACNVGPNIVIAEKRCWFSGVRIGDVASIVAYLKGGPDLPQLREKNEPELEEMIFAIIDAGLMPNMD
jgi:NADH:ubiquinone oxidoreductase subunit E